MLHRPKPGQTRMTFRFCVASTNIVIAGSRQNKGRQRAHTGGPFKAGNDPALAGCKNVPLLASSPCIPGPQRHETQLEKVAVASQTLTPGHIWPWIQHGTEAETKAVQVTPSKSCACGLSNKGSATTENYFASKNGRAMRLTVGVTTALLASTPLLQGGLGARRLNGSTVQSRR